MSKREEKKEDDGSFIFWLCAFGFCAGITGGNLALHNTIQALVCLLLDAMCIGGILVNRKI